MRVSERGVPAMPLDAGELECRHERSFATHRNGRARARPRASGSAAASQTQSPEVRIRPLAVYDALIG